MNTINILQKTYLHQRPGSKRKNSISCLDNSIFCFVNQFELLTENEKLFAKEVL